MGRKRRTRYVRISIFDTRSASLISRWNKQLNAQWWYSGVTLRAALHLILTLKVVGTYECNYNNSVFLTLILYFSCGAEALNLTCTIVLLVTYFENMKCQMLALMLRASLVTSLYRHLYLLQKFWNANTTWTQSLRYYYTHTVRLCVQDGKVNFTKRSVREAARSSARELDCTQTCTTESLECPRRRVQTNLT